MENDKSKIDDMMERSRMLRLMLFGERRQGYAFHKAKHPKGCNLCGFFKGYTDEQIKTMQEAFALSYIATVYESLNADNNINALLIHTFFEQLEREELVNFFDTNKGDIILDDKT